MVNKNKQIFESFFNLLQASAGYTTSLYYIMQRIDNPRRKLICLMSLSYADTASVFSNGMLVYT